MPIGTYAYHMQRPLKPDSRGAKLLTEIADAAGAALIIGIQPRAVLRYGVGGAKAFYERKVRRERIAAVLRLKLQQLVVMSKTAQGLRIALTEKGRFEAFRLAVHAADLFEDGRMCMVVFDIPESKRSLRKTLRAFLLQAGFMPLQRSVWLSPFNATVELERLFVATGAKKWVRVFTVQEI